MRLFHALISVQMLCGAQRFASNSWFDLNWFQRLMLVDKDA
ncbi:hypothetical protein SynA1560_02071 [Synechococcus sp. A15-60]|nr:hypothetical protein SynA1560_02071 [Synechococcus sp. A15-60]